MKWSYASQLIAVTENTSAEVCECFYFQFVLDLPYDCLC